MVGDLHRGAGHVGEIVTRAEHRAVGRDDDTVGVRCRHRLQSLDDLEHGVERQRVALLGAVEGDGGDGTVTREGDVVEAHPFSLARLRAGDTRRRPTPWCALRGSNPRPAD